jgi:hypothetical protein
MRWWWAKPQSGVLPFEPHVLAAMRKKPLINDHCHLTFLFIEPELNLRQAIV